MKELFKMLMDKEVRSAVRFALELIESVEKTATELEEVRAIGLKLQEENTKVMNDVMALRKDKEALIQFIENNVTDEEELKKIFKG